MYSVVKTTSIQHQSASPQAGDQRHLVTKKQLAAILNLPSTRMIDEMMRRRRIPFLKLGHRTIRFNVGRVREALTRLEVREIGN